MTDQHQTGMSIFDLLSRGWDLGAPIKSVAFSGDGSTVAFLLENGKLALMPCEDAEPPDVRTNLDIETGRTTIRPRTALLGSPRYPDVTAAVCSDIHGYRGFGFILTNSDGAVVEVTPAGQVLPVVRLGQSDNTVISASATTKQAAIAQGQQITQIGPEGEISVTEAPGNGAVTAIALSSDGSHLAIHQDDLLGIRNLQDPTGRTENLDMPGRASLIAWQPGNKRLVCALDNKTLAIADRHTGQVQIQPGFAADVRSALFSEASNTLLASGAFRLAGWSLDDLPGEGSAGTALTSGKPALVLVEAIAHHPSRPLCAAGFASGMLNICLVGKPDEMSLYMGTGAAVTALDWSADGKHLAAGFADGMAAIVTFPKQMFK